MLTDPSKLHFHSKTAISATLILLFVNLTLLCWYLFLGYQVDFNSDSAAKTLLAREIISTKDYFPDDWNNANNDLWVFFGHLFVIPLLTVMSGGYKVHAISGLISSILILWGVWLISSMASLGLARRILIVAVVATGISDSMADPLFGQGSYGSGVFFCCFLLFFSWKFLKTAGKKSFLWALSLLVLSILAYWANPLRAIVNYGIPLLIAVLWLFWEESSQRSKCLQLLAITGASIVIGAALHFYTIAGVQNTMGAGHVRWLTYELMIRNLALIPQGILANFGGLPTADVALVSKTGLYEALRFATALSIIVLTPVAVIKAVRQGGGGMRFIGVFTACAFSSVFFLLITTTIPDMSNPVASSRYLIPSLLLGLIVFLASPYTLIRNPFEKIAIVVIVFTLATSAPTTYNTPVDSFLYGTRADGSLVSWDKVNSRNHELADFLVKNGLKYGYATFWNAGATSVLSNEKSLVRQIVIEKGVPSPYRWLSSNRWYKPRTWQGETFLLLTDIEASQLNWDKLHTYGIKPDRLYVFNEFKIFVFNENLANLLPGWDNQYENNTPFIANKYSLTQIGRFVEESSAEKGGLIAEKGQSGALHYGPFVNVQPGRYEVIFNVVANHNPAGAVKLDIFAAPDEASNEKIYGEKFLKSSNGPQQLVFTLDKARTMEFRVWALGNEKVIFRSVSIKRLSNA